MGKFLPLWLMLYALLKSLQPSPTIVTCWCLRISKWLSSWQFSWKIMILLWLVLWSIKLFQCPKLALFATFFVLLMWPYHRTRPLRNMGPKALSYIMFLLLNLVHLSLASCYYVSITLQKRHPCIEKSMHHNFFVYFEVSLIFTFIINRLLWKRICTSLRTFLSILTCDEIHVLYAFSISCMHLIPCFSSWGSILGGDYIYMWGCVLCSTYLIQWKTSQSCLVATPCIWNAYMKWIEMSSELLF
jgi:hypothetical protein